MGMILRAVFIFALLFAAVYAVLYLATMTPYFNKRRNKRIARRALFGVVSAVIAGCGLALVLNLIN